MIASFVEFIDQLIDYPINRASLIIYWKNKGNRTINWAASLEKVWYIMIHNVRK